MSEIASCRLETAHKMIGTTPLWRDPQHDLPMEVGTALEPVVISLLLRRGLDIQHHGNWQLEVRIDDTLTGHPDGIIYGLNEPDWVLFNQLPNPIIEVLHNDKMCLLEVKTMNSRRFEAFKRLGLNADGLMAKYFWQIQTYLGALNFGHNNMDLDFKGIKDCLLVAFNTDTKKMAFLHVQFDEQAFKEALEYKQSVLRVLDSGELPEPDFSGGDQECFFCRFSHLCPAAQAVAAKRQVKTTEIVEQEQRAAVNALAQQYLEFKAQEVELKVAKESVRDELLALVGSRKLVTDQYVVLISESQGRTGVDQDRIKEILGEMGVDVPMKLGAPYSVLRVKRLIGEEE